VLQYNGVVSLLYLLACALQYRCINNNAAVVAQTAEAASQQGLNAQITRMQMFYVAYHAYERVILTRLTPVLSDSAALQQYDLRRHLTGQLAGMAQLLPDHA
jgi:hypothetical protein